MAGGGRSYEFSPETADPSSRSRSKMRGYKEKVSQEARAPRPGGEKISYGKRFARTEELYQARLMNRQLEELARADGALGEQERAQPKRSRPPKGQQPLRSRHQVLVEVSRGAPIGALPPSAEPPSRATISEVLGDAGRYLQMLRGGLRDARTAGMHLARLPLDLATVMVSRLRLQRA